MMAWRPRPQHSQVVLIGTAQYTDPKLTDLPAVQATISDLAAALTDPTNGIVPRSNCTILLDKGDIRLIGSHLRSTIRSAEDLLLIYYAGHGLIGGRRHDLYLALPDSEWGEPEFNSLEYAKLRNAILDSRASTKIVILDCCFSGRVIADTLADTTTAVLGQIEVDGTYVLTSASHDEVSLALPGERHTAFTGRFLQLLYTGIRGARELLTINDIYQELVRLMAAESLPIPRSRSMGSASQLALFPNMAFEALTQETVPSESDFLHLKISGRYQPEEFIGQGSSGVVYRGRDKVLNRDVALKLLRSDLVSNQESRENFQNEARKAGRISAPNLVRIYDVDTYSAQGVDGVCIIMEFIWGRSLEDLLKRSG